MKIESNMLYLAVHSSSEQWDCFVLNIGILRYDPEQGYRNPDIDHAYNDLVAHTQTNQNSPLEYSYAWEIRYQQPFSIDLERAEAMASTLRTIYRKMNKMRDTEGCATSFGHYINQFARAIGAIGFVRFEGNDYRTPINTFKLGEIVYIVDNIIVDYHERHKIAVA